MTVFLIGVLAVLAAQDPGGFEVTASVAPDRVSLGQCALLTVDAVGAAAADCEITRFPAVEGLHVEGVDSRIFRRRTGDGGAAGVLVARYRFRLYPLRAGALAIPPVEVTARGNIKALTPALSLSAAKGEPLFEGDGFSLAFPGGGEVFLRQCVQVDVVIRRGSLPGRISLPFLDSSRAAGGGTGLIRVEGDPPAAGDVVVGVPVIETGREEPFLLRPGGAGGSDDFLVGAFLFRVLRTGSFSFEPAFFAEGSGKPGDPVRYAIRECPSFLVVNLPEEGRPPFFTDGVGSFRVAFEAADRRIRVGDSFFLRFTVFGRRGALEFLDLPGFEDLAGSFRVFGTTDGAGAAANGGFSKWRLFELSPLSTAVERIPSLSFSWFDPAKKAYETYTWEGLSIDVLAGEGDGPPAASIREAARDIETIYRELPERGASFLVLLHVFLAATAFAAAAAWVVGRAGIFRKDEAAERVEKALARLRTGIETIGAGAGAGALARLLSAFVEERFRLPRGTGLSGGAAEALFSRGVPRELGEEAERLFSRLDALRFSEEGSEKPTEGMVRDTLGMAGRLDREGER